MLCLDSYFDEMSLYSWYLTLYFVRIDLYLVSELILLGKRDLGPKWDPGPNRARAQMGPRPKPGRAQMGPGPKLGRAQMGPGPKWHHYGFGLVLLNNWFLYVENPSG